jgi:hypothetical protein
MKNKKTLYILIPLVGLIWGVVICKVIDYQPSDKDINSYALQATEEHNVDTTKYELRFGYRDPFLRSSVRPATNSSSGKLAKANNIKQVEMSNLSPVTRPSDLVYRGEIEGHRYKLGLLEVAGKRVLVREQSTVGEYTILAVESDSLILRYCEKRFTYGKQ